MNRVRRNPTSRSGVCRDIATRKKVPLVTADWFGIVLLVGSVENVVRASTDRLGYTVPTGSRGHGDSAKKPFRQAKIENCKHTNFRATTNAPQLIFAAPGGAAAG